METLVIDSHTPMDALLSFAGAKRLPDPISISEIFDRLPIDTTGYIFSRDEANNYE